VITYQPKKKVIILLKYKRKNEQNKN